MFEKHSLPRYPRSDLQHHLKSVKDYNSLTLNHQIISAISINGQAHLERAEALSESLDDPAYLKQRADDIRYSTTEGIDAVMKEHNLDALLFANNSWCSYAGKSRIPIHYRASRL